MATRSHLLDSSEIPANIIPFIIKGTKRNQIRLILPFSKSFTVIKQRVADLLNRIITVYLIMYKGIKKGNGLETLSSQTKNVLSW